VTLNTSSEDVALVRAEAILQNLGYLSGGSLDTAVRAFQRDYNVDADPAPTGLVDGQVPAATFSRLEEIQTNPVSAQKA
jgi:peptidoglycan hydrolase-like protein with peptidoglycan-binding domain